MAKTKNAGPKKLLSPPPITGKRGGKLQARRRSSRNASSREASHQTPDTEEGQIVEDDAEPAVTASTQQQPEDRGDARDKGKGKAKVDEVDAVAVAAATGDPVPDPSSTSAWVPGDDDDDDEVMLLQTGEEDPATAQRASASTHAATSHPFARETAPIRQRSSSPLTPLANPTPSPGAKIALHRVVSPPSAHRLPQLEAYLGSSSEEEPARSPSPAEVAAPPVSAAPPVQTAPPVQATVPVQAASPARAAPASPMYQVTATDPGPFVPPAPSSPTPRAAPTAAPEPVAPAPPRSPAPQPAAEAPRPLHPAPLRAASPAPNAASTGPSEPVVPAEPWPRPLAEAPPLPREPPVAVASKAVDPSTDRARRPGPGTRLFQSAMTDSRRPASSAQASRPLASRLKQDPPKPEPPKPPKPPMVSFEIEEEVPREPAAERAQGKSFTIKGAATANGRKPSPAPLADRVAGPSAAAPTTTRERTVTSSKSPSPPRPPQPPVRPPTRPKSNGAAPPPVLSHEDDRALAELRAQGQRDADAAAFRDRESRQTPPHLSKRPWAGDNESPDRSKRSRTTSHRDERGEHKRKESGGHLSQARDQYEDSVAQWGDVGGAAQRRTPGHDPRARDPAYQMSYELDDAGLVDDRRARDDRPYSSGYRDDDYGRAKDGRRNQYDRYDNARHHGGGHSYERRSDHEEDRRRRGADERRRDPRDETPRHRESDAPQRGRYDSDDHYDRSRPNIAPDHRDQGAAKRGTSPSARPRAPTPSTYQGRDDSKHARSYNGRQDSYRPRDDWRRSTDSSPATSFSAVHDRERPPAPPDVEPPAKRPRFEPPPPFQPPPELVRARQWGPVGREVQQPRENGSAAQPPSQGSVMQNGLDGWSPSPTKEEPRKESEKEPGEVEEGEIKEPTPPTSLAPPEKSEPIRIALPSMASKQSTYMPHHSVFQPAPPKEPPPEIPPPPLPQRKFDYAQINLYAIRSQPGFFADERKGLEAHAGMVPGPVPKDVVASSDRDFPGESPIGHYELLYKLGEGTFGEVVKGVYWGEAFEKDRRKVGEAKPRPGMRVKGGDEVAIKRIITHKESDGMPITSLREIRLLRRLDHPNIVPVVDMAHALGDEKARQRAYTYMIFPYLQHDLAGIISNPKNKLTVAMIKLFAKQLLQGLSYLHGNGILHRDMKTANLLVSNTGQLKIADFGLARPVQPMKDGVKYTACVVTRWYRPPEILLGERRYNVPVDMWGVGCVIAEMFEKKQILAGDSDLKQCHLIFQLCGHPTEESMPGWDRLEGCDGINRWSPAPRCVLAKFTRFGDSLAKLLDQLLVLDPTKRLTALQALDQKWFQEGPRPPNEINLDWADSHEYDGRKASDLARQGHDKQLSSFTTVPRPRSEQPQHRPAPAQAPLPPHPALQRMPPGHRPQQPLPGQIHPAALNQPYAVPSAMVPGRPPYHPPQNHHQGPLATKHRAGVQTAAAPMPGLPARPSMAAAPLPGHGRMSSQVPMPGGRGSGFPNGTPTGSRHHNGPPPQGAHPPQWRY